MTHFTMFNLFLRSKHLVSYIYGIPAPALLVISAFDNMYIFVDCCVARKCCAWQRINNGTVKQTCRLGAVETKMDDNRGSVDLESLRGNIFDFKLSFPLTLFYNVNVLFKKKNFLSPFLRNSK